MGQVTNGSRVTLRFAVAPLRFDVVKRERSVRHVAVWNWINSQTDNRTTIVHVGDPGRPMERRDPYMR